jgi:outer membrane protein
MFMRWTWQRVRLYVLCLAVLSAPAHAQSPSSGGIIPVKLTLAEAVRLALKQNPQRIIAEVQVQQTQRDQQLALSALLPQASLTANAYIRQYNLQSVTPTPKPEFISRFQAMWIGPAFSQSILDLGLIRRYQIGRESVRGATAQESATREDVTTVVVTEYLQVLRAFAAFEAAKSRVALAERLYNQAVELQKTGIGLRIDTLRANVELQNERQRLIDTQTATRTSIYALAEVLDLPRDQEPEVTDRLQFYDLPAYDRAALLERALNTRPEIKAILSQQRTAELSRKAAGEQRLPRLGFLGYWRSQGRNPADFIPAYLYTATFEIPLITSGQIRADIGKAQLEEQRLAEQRRQVEAQIVREVKTALDELESARKAVEVANLGLTLATDEVAQSERRFAAGVTTNVEVITAQDAFSRASDNQIDALYRFNQSRANLARAMGEIESTYSK